MVKLLLWQCVYDFCPLGLILVEVVRSFALQKGKSIRTWEHKPHSLWHCAFFTSQTKYDQCVERIAGVKYF